MFNYPDFSDHKASNGVRYEPAGGIELYFFASWLYGLAVSQFPKNHSMERYRLDVLETAKRHPRNEEYWERYGYLDIVP